MVITSIPNFLIINLYKTLGVKLVQQLCSLFCNFFVKIIKTLSESCFKIGFETVSCLSFYRFRIFEVVQERPEVLSEMIPHVRRVNQILKLNLNFQFRKFFQKLLLPSGRFLVGESGAVQLGKAFQDWLHVLKQSWLKMSSLCNFN